MEFSRPEYWSGQSSPSPRNLHNPEIEPRSPTLQADSSSEPQGKPKNTAVGSLTQEANQGLKHYRQILYQLSYQGRREMKGKGEKERYTHLNPEFQRIARRDKKAFLSNQCKEMEENNRLGKTRDLFKKIRDTKGTFHAKKGTIKDRNGLGLKETEDIKKRWQKYTEELYKKDLHDPDNHDGVITHLARHPGM